MATQSSPNLGVGSIPGINDQINTEQQRADSLQSALGSSPGSFGSTPPSQSDLSNQQALEKLRGTISKLNDSKLKAQWYPTKAPDSNPGDNTVSPGMIGTVLNTLQLPMLGIAGAVKHVVGQGDGSFTEDMTNNMLRDKTTYGDILSRAGAPGILAVPLGFALDIGLDPVNWATMGEEAFVPKLAGGLFRGGVEGLGAAAVAGGLEKAVAVSKYTPFLRKSEYFAQLGEQSLAATAKYESITGRTIDSVLMGHNGPLGYPRVPLSEVINKVAEMVPGGYGTKVLSTLIYDPVDWVRQTVQMDIIKRSFGSAGVVDVAGAMRAKAAGESIDPFMQSAKTAIESTPVGPYGDLTKAGDESTSMVSRADIDAALSKLPQPVRDRLMEAASPLVHRVDDAVEIGKNPEIGQTGDALANGLRIYNESQGTNLTLSDIATAVESGALGDTGVQWFDNMMTGIKNYGAKVDDNKNRIGGIGEKALTYYDGFMSLFKGAVVGGSPTGHFNAMIGNAVMNHLGIGDIGPEYWVRYKQVRDMYKNVPGSVAKIQGLMQDAGVWGEEQMALMREMPTGMRSVSGDMTGYLTADSVADYFMKNLVSDSGVLTGTPLAGISKEELAKFAGPGMDDMKAFMASLKPDAALSKEEFAALTPAEKAARAKVQGLRGVVGGTSIVRSIKEGQKVARMEVGTDVVSQELFDSSTARKMMDWFAEKAKANPMNPFYTAGDFVYNKMSNTYATYDQMAKTTTLLRSVLDGYDRTSLLKASRLIDISPEDYSAVVRDGNTFYRLSARKAIELSNALYMNYAAMPSAVRVLRNMPFIGNPFISFMYGMALKTGQTLAYNPSAFNQVSFALHEFGGQQTPLEKNALTGNVYKYLNQPGMVKVPFVDAFFDNKPVYANLANAIPYYSMNLFTPTTGSGYAPGSGWGASFANVINASPFVKHPIGSIMFNNLVMPALLQEGIQPENAFGTPIWPSDANFLTKLGYSARDLIGSVTPGVFALAGAPGGLIAPQLTPLSPSFKYRVLANAVHGQNVYGVTGKESATSRGVRAGLGILGIPLQSPVDTNFTPQQQNKP